MRLTRGTQDLLQDCPTEQPNCQKKVPEMVRYTALQNYKDRVEDIVPCTGPRGLPMNESDDDAIWAYNVLPKGENPARSWWRSHLELTVI